MKLQKMLAAVMATSMVFTAVPVMNGVNVSAASYDKIGLQAGWFSIHSVKHPTEDIKNKTRGFNLLIDGNKNDNYMCAIDSADAYVENNGDSLYYEVDLKDEYELNDIKMWRYPDGRTYLDTIIVASEDNVFDESDTVIYNAADSAHATNCGFPSTAGKDKTYAEAATTSDAPNGGHDFPVANAKARYVRIYMAGSTKNNSPRHGGCHMTELEIYGAKVHTVTFNDKVDGTDDTTVEVLSGDTLSMPTPPTRDGYTFTGWYTNDACTDKYNNETQTWTNSNGDLTLYAGWEANLTGITVSGGFGKNIFEKGETVNNLKDLFTVKTAYTDNAKEPVDVTGAASTSVTTTLDTATLGKQNVTVTAEYTYVTATSKETYRDTTDVVPVKVIDGTAKAALDAAIAEAEVVDTTNTKYSEASRTAFDEAKTAAKELKANLEDVTNDAFDDANNVAGKLTDAIDGLEKMCKITVPVGATVSAAKGEEAGQDDNSKWIYVPMLEEVTITAPEINEDGKKFVAWVCDGRKVSISDTYTFYALNDMNMQPTYDASVEEEAEVTMTCTTKYLETSKKRAFIAKRSVARKCKEVLEYGVVITDQKGWNDTYQEAPDTLVKGATRTKSTSVTKNVYNGTFQANFSCKRSDKWYGRAYVKYKDANGKVQTYYSNVIKY